MSSRKRDNRIERINAVRREYLVAVAAIDSLDAALTKNPSLFGRGQIGRADVRNLRHNLEGTYLIRLFAEFESGLRDAWVNFFGRDPGTRVTDVISSVGVQRGVPDAVQQNAHAVRKYRNSLVHAEDGEAQLIALGRAKSYLCTFFSRLPPDW